jgi:hypothetical protein
MQLLAIQNVLCRVSWRRAFRSGARCVGAIISIASGEAGFWHPLLRKADSQSTDGVPLRSNPVRVIPGH